MGSGRENRLFYIVLSDYFTGSSYDRWSDQQYRKTRQISPKLWRCFSANPPNSDVQCNVRFKANSLPPLWPRQRKNKRDLAQA